MRILVGSLGNLGYLVKPLPARGERPSWRRFEDEISLISHLRALEVPEPQIRGLFRTLRGEGRSILVVDDRNAGVPAGAPPQPAGRHRVAAR